MPYLSVVLCLTVCTDMTEAVNEKGGNWEDAAVCVSCVCVCVFPVCVFPVCVCFLCVCVCSLCVCLLSWWLHRIYCQHTPWGLWTLRLLISNLPNRTTQLQHCVVHAGSSDTPRTAVERQHDLQDVIFYRPQEKTTVSSHFGVPALGTEHSRRLGRCWVISQLTHRSKVRGIPDRKSTRLNSSHL